MDAYLERYRELFTLPELTTDDCGPGIYCWYLENLEATSDFLPLYIGQSMNLWERCSTHEKELKRKFVELEQILNDQEAQTDENNQELLFQRHNNLYIRVANILMARSIKPPYNLKFKVIQKIENDAPTYDTLMSIERRYIHYYGADLLGLNEPLFLEWSKRVEGKRQKGEASQEDWQILLQLLSRPIIDRQLVVHSLSEVLEDQKLNFLLFCPYLELCNGILLEYLIKRRKEFQKIAKQHMNANGEITYRNGAAGLITAPCEVFEKDAVIKVYKRLNRRRRKKNRVSPFELSFDDIERQTRL